jgi:hypothetical protein
MVYYICGYFISYKTMKERIHLKETPHMTLGFRPYVRQMTNIISEPPNSLNASFDDIFSDSRPIALPFGSEDEDDNMGVILVRAQGEIETTPNAFEESEEDVMVKKVVEERLGFNIGSFQRVHFVC